MRARERMREKDGGRGEGGREHALAVSLTEKWVSDKSFDIMVTAPSYKLYTKSGFAASWRSRRDYGVFTMGFSYFRGRANNKRPHADEGNLIGIWNVPEIDAQYPSSLQARTQLWSLMNQGAWSSQIIRFLCSLWGCIFKMKFVSTEALISSLRSKYPKRMARKGQLSCSRDRACVLEGVFLQKTVTRDIYRAPVWRNSHRFVNWIT